MHCWEEDKKANVRAQGVLRQRGKRSSHDGLLLGHDGLVVELSQTVFLNPRSKLKLLQGGSSASDLVLKFGAVPNKPFVR